MNETTFTSPVANAPQAPLTLNAQSEALIAATARWKKLGEYLLVKYIDGNVKKEADGQFKRNPYGLPASPDFPGYDEEYYRSIVRSAGERLEVK